MHRFANPARFMRLSGTLLPWVGAGAGIFLAAGLYLTAGHNTAPFIVIALFTAAAACLIVAIGAAAAVYRALKPEPLPVTLEGGQQAL